MKRLQSVIAGLLLCAAAFATELPDSVYVAVMDGHVQGIALDKDKGCMYFSFTSSFIKTDLQGNILGTIGRIQGHLGAMTLGPDGRVYASLECKDDAIGQGIAKRLGVENLSHEQSVFYVAIIDVDRIDRVVALRGTDAFIHELDCAVSRQVAARQEKTDAKPKDRGD